jgi:hypothetical protein
MNRSRWIPVAVVLALCGLSGSARAGLVTINFSGPVTQKNDPGNLVSPSFGAPGTTVSGVLQYDTAAPPFATSSGVSDYPYSNFSLSLNGTTLPGHIVPIGYDVTVTDALFVGALLHAGGTLNDPGLFPHFSSGNIAFDLNDFTTTAFSSTNLPTSLNLAAFQEKTFQITMQATTVGDIAPSLSQSVNISGTIDNLSVDTSKPRETPEPASGLLFGLGLLGTAAVAWRRQRASAA